MLIFMLVNLPYFAETYNAIIAVGALAPNHITAVAFKEMLRIIKKGKTYPESSK